MKTAIFVVFELDAALEGLIKALSAKGYNGAIIPSSSFTSALLAGRKEEKEPLSSLEISKGVIKGNPTFFTLVEERDIEKVRAIINEYTADFCKIKGGMFGVPLTFFEGSF